MKRLILLLLLLLTAFVYADAQTQVRRQLSKQELNYLSHKVDSIKRNLNRMIRYEHDLMQRNYYLNEKTALVDELISTLKYLQNSVEVVALSKANIRKIFGRPSADVPGRLIYEIETFKSNCPFLEMVFTIKDNLVTKVEYRITECQKWK